MATTRVGYVGTEAIGDVLTKANFDRLPGGEVGRITVTSPTTAITGTTTVATLTITAGTSRRYRITATWPLATIVGTSTGAPTTVNIYDNTGTTQLAATYILPSGGAGQSVPGQSCMIDHEPAAGSQTYLFRQTTPAAATITLFASATVPISFTIDDVGPTY